MIVKIGHGGRTGGLMSYLASEGRFNEHENARIIGGSDELTVRFGDGELSHASALEVAGLIDADMARFGTEVRASVREWDEAKQAKVKVGDKPAHVYHLILAASPEDGALTDQQWGEIATKMMDELGFTEASGKAPAAWVAVNHGQNTAGADHIHIVASRVRSDGTKVSVWNDYRTASRVCREVEREHGLTRVEGREAGRGEAGTTRAEYQKAVREAREPAREELRSVLSQCAVQSSTEDEFVRRVRRSGALIRPRFAAGRNDVVTGYSVALRPPVQGQKPIWFGGGNIGKEFTLPNLRKDFQQRDPEQVQKAVDEWRAAAKGQKIVHPGREVTEVKQQQIARVDAELDKWTAYLRSVPVENQAEWARAAARTSGVVRTLATRVGEPIDGPMNRLARQLDRSAVAPRGSSIPRDRSMPRLTGAAMILAQTSRDLRPATAYAMLLSQVVETVEAISRARQAANDAREAQRLVDAMRTQHAAVVTEHPRVGEPEFVMAVREKSAQVRARLETRLPTEPTKASSPALTAPRSRPTVKASDNPRDRGR